MHRTPHLPQLKIKLASICLLLAACAAQPPAPIEQMSPVQKAPAVAAHPKPIALKPVVTGRQYRVQPGDTLYSIAWRLGVDYRRLAKWNNIRDPHKIYVGQSLIVQGASKPLVAHAARAPSGAPAAQPPQPPQRVTPVAPPQKSPSVHHALKWAWPADGRPSRAVSATGSIGLEIRGERGQPVRAASNGQVVYGGNGLRGYGQLLIIKHNDNFLSAYAHNDKLLVQEGQAVTQGQTIALMGDSGASEVMLHFEIRKDGKAVEPLQFLPKR